MLVIDDKKKNRRVVCAATEAGYIEYHHLPGAIKTGCQLSPLQSSQYCSHHAPCVTDQDKSDDSLIPSNERIIRVITGKRVTRNKTYYQARIIICYTQMRHLIMNFLNALLYLDNKMINCHSHAQKNIKSLVYQTQPNMH